MILSYNPVRGYFYINNPDPEVDFKELGFERDNGVWLTRMPSKAFLMKTYADTRTSEIIARASLLRSHSGILSCDAPLHEHPNSNLNYLPYQRAGIYFMSKLAPRALCAYEPGLGKTVVSSGLINECQDVRKVLVVVPASLRFNWKQELEKWVFRQLDRLEIVSYDSVWREKNFNDLLSESWDLIVFDEAHYLKEQTSKRSQACLALSKKTKRLVALTGTPIKNRIKDLYNIVQIINPKLFPDFNSFGLRYCSGFLQEISIFDPKSKKRKIKKVWNFNGASHVEELQDILRSTIMLRLTKEEALPQLPRKIRQIIEIPADFKSIKDENKLWREVCSEIGYEEAVKSLEDSAGVAFDKMAKVRKQVSLDKSEVVVKYMQDLLESVDKVVLFAHHRDVVTKLFEGLQDYNPVKFVGGMSDNDKAKAVNSFMNDENCRVFIGNINAAGVGLTLTAASTVVFAEASYVPSDLQQCEDRCCRIGAKTSSVLVQYIVLQNSIDAEMLKKVAKKVEIADRLLEEGLDI